LVDEPSDTGEPFPSLPAPDRETLLHLHGVLSDRRQNYDGLMWQVPALGLSAQAFLLTIALGSGSGTLARAGSSALAAMVALMSMQLMAKHRLHELADSMTLEKIERELSIFFLNAPPHAAVGTRLEQLPAAGTPWWLKWSSYRVWMAGLGAFAAVGLASLVFAVVDAF
jgi:hypothetical protein